MASCMPKPLCPETYTPPPISFSRWLRESPDQFRRFGEDKTSCHWRESKRPARSLVTTLTELSQLPKITYSLNTYGPFLGGNSWPCWLLQCSTQITRWYWIFFLGDKWRSWWLLQWSTRSRVFWHSTRNQLFIWRRGMWSYRFSFYRAQMSHRRR